ncbi:hypothetical protein [Algibacter pacificus]|uniref:hypothetical protein n=1 Tax=Algibacter pacificus TaxID=2599389 RepID=UPI0011CC174B|nr:hypothetical protein [Algibacter pacificus]
MKITKIVLPIVTIFLMVSFNACSKIEEYKYEKPKGLISNKVANIKEELYKAAVYNIIKDTLLDSKIPVKLNREIWFDIDELENYIHYVRETSKKQGYSNLGLRVYLGAVKEKGKIETTMFFAPTHSEEITRSAGSRNKNSSNIECLNYGTAGEEPEELD